MSGVHDDLATVRSWLRDAYSHDTPHAALDRVEAELSQLRHAESQARYYREKYEERAEELEIELARLREGLRRALDAMERMDALIETNSEAGTPDWFVEAEQNARALLADTPEDEQ